VSYDPEVADRVRQVLADQRGVTEQALGEPHVRPMLLGGRALSGFITVEPAGFAADGALAGWVRRGLDVAAGLPAKPDR